MSSEERFTLVTLVSALRNMFSVVTNSCSNTVVERVGRVSGERIMLRPTIFELEEDEVNRPKCAANRAFLCYTKLL